MLPDRSPRFAELDAQIQAEAEKRMQPPQSNQKRKPRRRSTPPLPAPVRKEITRIARELNRQPYRKLFTADAKLRDRVARFLRSLLPPRRKRGRPGLDSVTTAIRLRGMFRRSHPDEAWAKIWERIYPEAIANYDSMNQVEQMQARQLLRERVRWRLRDRKRKKLRSPVVT